MLLRILVEFAASIFPRRPGLNEGLVKASRVLQAEVDGMELPTRSKLGASM